MWLLTGLAVMLGWSLWVEAPAMWRGKRLKELGLLLAILALVITYGVLVSLHRPLFNPLDGIAAVLGPYPQAVYSIFK